MDLYLDASVIVALFIDDALTARARTLLEADPLTLLVSDFATAEVTAAIARQVRTRALSEAEARTAFGRLDHWIANFVLLAETTPADIIAATRFIRRLDLTLRAPDAINIAITQRMGATLATFDAGMAA